MNCPSIFNKVTLTVACLFFTLNCNAQDSNLIESTLHSTSYEEAMQNVEFEKFLIRYTTHYPTATIETTTKLAEKTLLEVCSKLSNTNHECVTKVDANNIETLLTEVAINKLSLSKATNTPLSEIDRSLTISGVTNIGDKYSRFVYIDNEPTDGQLDTTSVLSRDGTKLKINTFDSTMGCIEPNHLKNAEAIQQLDLRDNNGGDIKCTLETLSKFLPVGKHHVATVFTINGEEELWIEGQLTDNVSGKEVRVNKSTASSAEIFTIALEQSGWKVKGLPMMNKRSIQARFDTKFGNYHLTIGRFASM